MFPFQNSGELSFQTMEFVAGDDDQKNAENQIVWTDAELSAAMNPNVGFDLNNNSNRGGRGRGGGGGRGRGRSRRSSAAAGTIRNYDDDNDEQKKANHREVERQRRMEMSNLYASLRSTLPPEYIQGKRSTSDHIAEAANYIKDLEKNVKDLSDKRDELQATSSDNYHVGGSSNNPRSRQGSVVIEPHLGGISIDIDVGYEDESFCLSSALQIAFEEGISVSSCASTRAADRLIHKILCEVNDITCVDFNRLQWRLNDLVS